jgi:hypothetical protein
MFAPARADDENLHALPFRGLSARRSDPAFIVIFGERAGLVASVHRRFAAPPLSPRPERRAKSVSTKADAAQLIGGSDLSQFLDANRNPFRAEMH